MPDRCTVCGSGELRPLGPHLDFDAGTILGCESCTHGFTVPEPTKAELDRFYREIYGPSRRVYFGPEYNEIMRRRAAAQVNLLLEQMGRDDLNGLSVCDVGCGVGAAVAECTRRGADAMGLDSDAKAIAIGRNQFHADVSEGDLTTAAGERKFDVLLMSHVVEHLGRLQETMQEILAHLEPSGHLFVEVPTTYPVMFAERLDTEGHLQFFTRRSLGGLMERLGLQSLTNKSCGPPITRLVAQHRGARLGPIRGRLFRWAGKNRPLYTPECFAHYDRGEPEGIWLRCVARAC